MSFDAFWEMSNRSLPVHDPEALARAVWDHCHQRAERAEEPARCSHDVTEAGFDLNLLWAKVAELEIDLKAAAQIIHNAPELNMGNYQEDEVARLNAAAIQAFEILRKYMTTDSNLATNAKPE